MDSSFTRSPDAASTGPASPFHAEPATPPKRHGWIEGHCPDVIEPLEAPDADSAVAQTRYLRHDGWTPEKMRLFLQRFAECGVLREACEASGMSARSYYNLLDRDPLFAAGWRPPASRRATGLRTKPSPARSTAASSASTRMA